MLQLAAQIEAAATAVREKWTTVPRAGIILGSGLGDMAKEIQPEAILD